MKKHLLFVLAIGLCNAAFTQTYFRSGIFLHHSTGQYIWGPNPDGLSTTTIPDEMHLYNVAHSYTGNDSVSMTEEWWAPGDNEWSTQHAFFEGDTSYTDINYYLSNYKIIVIKSCFPSSELDSWGQPADTNDPTYKSVYNYKWHWRHILKVMKDHPANFFAIWTNAPLEVNSTTTQQAALADLFCTWAKDTLAAGLDAEFGAFPHNVYVFDYFHKVAGTDGIELPLYTTAPGDSHPNGAATDLVAPQFVDEIFSAAITYEMYYSIRKISGENSLLYYPNPIKEFVTFKCKLSQDSKLSLSIYDVTGRMIYKTDKNSLPAGEYSFNIDFSRYNQGVYFYNFFINEKIYSGKLLNE